MNELSAGLRTKNECTGGDRRATTLTLHGALLALLVLISGCASTPPSQEMSEARQSVEAAREQGADQLAPQAMNNADKLLSDAEDRIRQGQYGKAQRDAIAAREAARQARVITEVRQAQQQDDQPPPPAPPTPREPDAVATAPKAIARQTDPSTSTTYTVRAGDSLWNIAAHPSVYGDPHLWPLLLKTNADTLKDADLIIPGQKLRIEYNRSQPDDEAAANHARQRGAWRLGNTETSDNRYLNRYGLR